MDDSISIRKKKLDFQLKWISNQFKYYLDKFCTELHTVNNKGKN